MEEMGGVWPAMLPEIRVLIRKCLDSPTEQMLRLTCKAEAAIIKPKCFVELFWDATSYGHIDICKFIYGVSEYWGYRGDEKNSEEGSEEEREVYRTLLFYDDALFHGQYHVAEWALQMNLPLREGCIRHLLINNKFEATQWAVAHGLKITDREINHSVTSMPFIRWLVEEQKMLPSEWTIFDCFRCLPRHEERLKYYLSLETTKVPVEKIMYFAGGGGHWQCLDFIKTHLPDEFAAVCSARPMLHQFYEERRHVPWGHTLDLTTGELIDDDD